MRNPEFTPKRLPSVVWFVLILDAVDTLKRKSNMKFESCSACRPCSEQSDTQSEPEYGNA
jgi:hypothetical protein